MPEINMDDIIADNGKEDFENEEKIGKKKKGKKEKIPKPPKIPKPKKLTLAERKELLNHCIEQKIPDEQIDLIFAQANCARPPTPKKPAAKKPAAKKPTAKSKAKGKLSESTKIIVDNALKVGFTGIERIAVTKTPFKLQGLSDNCIKDKALMDSIHLVLEEEGVSKLNDLSPKVMMLVCFMIVAHNTHHNNASDPKVAVNSQLDGNVPSSIQNDPQYADM